MILGWLRNDEDSSFRDDDQLGTVYGGYCKTCAKNAEVTKEPEEEGEEEEEEGERESVLQTKKRARRSIVRSSDEEND